MGEAADETFSPPPPVAAPRTGEPTSPKSAARRRWTRVASQRTLSDAPAAAPQTGKRVTKVVYLARHGEGVHEIAAEVERDVAHAAALARDPAAEKPAELADPAGEEFFNAGLTDRGRAQSARAAQELDALLARPHYPRPEAFFASPLHRTLETATILADGRVEVPVVAVDALREQRGGLPCDERDRADVVAADFPTVDASTIAAADDASPDGYVLREALVEDEAALAARAGEAVAWLRSLPFESVCLVAHRRLLRAVVRHGATTATSGAASPSPRATRTSSCSCPSSSGARGSSDARTSAPTTRPCPTAAATARTRSSNTPAPRTSSSTRRACSSSGPTTTSTTSSRTSP